MSTANLENINHEVNKPRERHGIWGLKTFYKKDLIDKANYLVRGLVKGGGVFIQEGASSYERMRGILDRDPWLRRNTVLLGPADNRGGQRLYVLLSKHKIERNSAKLIDIKQQFGIDLDAPLPPLSTDSEVVRDWTRKPLTAEFRAKSGRKLVAMNVHLKSPYVHWSNGDSDEEKNELREDNLRQNRAERIALREAWTAMLERDKNLQLIAGGDFNANLQETEHLRGSAMDKQHRMYPAIRAKKGKKKPYTVKFRKAGAKKYTYSVIDNIYVSRNIACPPAVTTLRMIGFFTVLNMRSWIEGKAHVMTHTPKSPSARRQRVSDHLPVCTQFEI